MRKADLLDELRSEIGVVSDKCKGEIDVLYRFVCQILYEKVSAYQFVSIYLVKQNCFYCHTFQGSSTLPRIIPFGEGLLSVAAMHAGVMVERVGSTVQAVAPFYCGHHLVGELVILSSPNEKLDDEDISLFHELASLFERKVKESYF
ncbi:hypothetical protein [Thermoflavimicrobium dichotomicum]|uniref:GAF domain-containing protein, putative methionine-R-sulfoxide reductase n=1 Tax=Thermoflavimicrobium dichotomicum TaxID=46223 RepID=A0A1I3N9N2_9BACL|nr:hypothetical protein [Thermoflavimicrobium dichotomicum]SFJ05835.1 GAF domain-containing protein, putative methionine-R-sulfoxide reductase [Thermoflavimicrobium dichotomicum]